MHKQALLFILLCFSFSTMSADIFLADRQFTEKKYEQAKASYLEAAELGNPHAYYQLANMYFNGLGGDKDPINAMLYFYLAAEQNFHNSEKLITDILASLSPDEKDNVLKILDEYKQSHGKQQILQRYFPIIDKEKQQTLLTFNGEETLKTVFHPEDADMENFMSTFGGDTFFEDDGSSDFAEDSIELLISTPKTPFLILDHDIHTDGSVRYSTQVQKFGLYKPLLEQFALFPLATPEFNGTPVDFASRTYLGAAALNKFALLNENPKIYEQVIRQTRKFKNGKTISDRFNLAILMLNFPWVEQTENEAEEILLSLSKQGHSPAMYEYGFKLYREQRDIEQAIFWISEASKYGLVRAEYRLAKILQSSPWVINDEKKALFWFESAMEKGEISARIRATDILFTSTDESIQSYDLAVEYLKVLEEFGIDDPEYHYLTALKFKQGEHRNIKLAVENLEKAIFRGQLNNWDVSAWQDLLRDITTGKIFVTDFES
ncbi:tetratricopeptide repeat protein [Glaciecola sp. SC05]|uniref:tetratricopeptide repeat protein n=1 Tax=Glaciecola sp. SC05 TaxID=1987355 RepID=UPI003529B737